MMPRYHNPAIEIERAPASLFHIINFSFSITSSIWRIRAHPHVEQLSEGAKETMIKSKRVFDFPTRVSAFPLSSSASLRGCAKQSALNCLCKSFALRLDKLCLLAISQNRPQSLR